jgi:hypothetical protein
MSKAFAGFAKPSLLLVVMAFLVAQAYLFVSHRLGLLTTAFFLAIFLLLGTPWLLFITG